MACCLFGTKPLSKPMVVYCRLDLSKQISVKVWSKYKNFSFRKMHLKISSAKWWPFCPGGDELIEYTYPPQHNKVRLHGRRQAARLARDMLQRDLLRGNSVYTVGSCRARLLHTIHVSAVSEVGVLQENCSRQHVPRGNFKFKLKLPPGLTAVARLLRTACRCVNAPVVFLCFYFAARLAHCSRATCHVPCKRSYSMHQFTA